MVPRMPADVIPNHSGTVIRLKDTQSILDSFGEQKRQRARVLMRVFWARIHTTHTAKPHPVRLRHFIPAICCSWLRLPRSDLGQPVSPSPIYPVWELTLGVLLIGAGIFVLVLPSDKPIRLPESVTSTDSTSN